ncbi:signal peptidase I [Actinokineospora baliensis]|uniref:S26 family signal peptidase n=1 Tax=Actinokineospora baliensis TaxID=547056 RepID=UPI0019577252|nr:S26 family signal peptidase [Actinokineospora baliensis]MBM7772264.1 signal peptidase I [Actinokineospora baliensis]
MAWDVLTWGLVGAVVAGLVVVLWLRSRVVYVDVVGRSMLPTFGPGDRVRGKRVGSGGVRVGDVVVVDSPRATMAQLTALISTPTPIVEREQAIPAPAGRGPNWVIKRVAALPGEPVPAEVRAAAGRAVVPPGHLVVLGDNPAQSIDSRQQGFLLLDKVLAVVPVSGE